MAVYAAMIEQMDRGIGAIMDAVRARPDRDNTMVMFLSDNGGCAEEIFPSGNAAEDFPRQTRAGQPVHPGNVPTINPGAGGYICFIRAGVGDAVGHAVSAVQEFCP